MSDFGALIQQLRKAHRPRMSAQVLAEYLDYRARAVTGIRFDRPVGELGAAAVDALRAAGWHYGAGSAGRSRIANIENGRGIGSVTHAECKRLEEALGQPDESLWRALLRDQRKLDPEVHNYYEAMMHRWSGTP